MPQANVRAVRAIGPVAKIRSPSVPLERLTHQVHRSGGIRESAERALSGQTTADARLPAEGIEVTTLFTTDFERERLTNKDGGRVAGPADSGGQLGGLNQRLRSWGRGVRRRDSVMRERGDFRGVDWTGGHPGVGLSSFDGIACAAEHVKEKQD